MEHGGRRRISTSWGELQHDLLQRICDYVEPSAQWAMRHVSAHWREWSGTTGCQHLAIATAAERLSNKIAILHAWRNNSKLCNPTFSFVIAVPITLPDLASLLQGLPSQVEFGGPSLILAQSHAPSSSCLTLQCAVQLDSLTSCNICVTLVIAQSDGLELVVTAKQVATSAYLLKQHQIALHISVRPANETTIVPSQYVLQPLRPFLLEFDTCSIPTDQPAAGRTASTAVLSTISYDQVSSLFNSDPSVCTFSTSTESHIQVPSSVRMGIVYIVAGMTNLTKLHLTIADNFYQSTIDFQPLGQLVLLTDLALQIVHSVPTCCKDVLKNNRQTLQFVTLTAGSWTPATYCSLQHVPLLKVLNLSIMEIDEAQTQALVGVTAEVFRLTLHGGFPSHGIQALHNSQPEVHELTLRNPNCRNFQKYLPELPSLQRLTLRECAELSGKSLPPYPQVTQLTLIDCHLITGPGMQHIIRTALPALKVISFHLTSQCEVAVLMSVRSLNALHFGPNLQCIDLRGVLGLTSDRVTQLCNTLHRKQRFDKVQPCVTLLLPTILENPEEVYETLSTGMGVLKNRDTILLPNLYKLPSRPHVNKVVIKK